jgi:hypothetical protein
MRSRSAITCALTARTTVRLRPSSISSVDSALPYTLVAVVDFAPMRSSRWSPTRIAFAIAVSAGLTAPILGKKLVSTT